MNRDRDLDATINILIVDDEASNLVVLETILDDPRYRLIRAVSADEALLALMRHEFALLILDVRMPGMDGIELARIIKERKKTASVPIIFLTAYHDEDQHIAAGYGSGAVDFLSKPVNAAMLRSKVAVFADLDRKSRTIAKANEDLRQLNQTLEDRVSERTEALRRADLHLRDLLAAEQAARAEVDRVGRAKDDFLASLSHELRTPLAAILGWANVLQRPQVDAATFRRGIEVIARNAKAQSQLVSDLLEVSRVESGKQRMDFHSVDLNDVVAVAVDTLGPAAQAQGVKVVTRLERSGTMTVMGDEARLHQVVANLVTNALKFSAPGTTVSVETAATPTHVELRVVDVGDGISAEFLPHIFERFSQADSSAARVHGGLGLGLAIVKNLVEIHAGSVEAFSDGPGRGSTFTVRIPIALERRSGQPSARPDHATQHEVDAGARPSEWDDLSGITVLLVDDHPDVLEVQRRILCEAGATVEIATHAADALERIRAGRFDAMLSDLGMPGMDGYSLMRAVRRELGLTPAQLPSAAVTAFVRAQDRERALEHGYQLFVQKPISAADLVKTVRSLVPLRHAVAARSDNGAPVASTRALQALYVEDNLDLRDQIGFMLEEEGVEVTAFGTAEDALEACMRQRFDVVIADITLPGMSGVDLARLILKRDAGAWVIFCTGHAMEDSLGRLGPNVRTLIKPFDLDQLHDALEEVRAARPAGP